MHHTIAVVALLLGTAAQAAPGHAQQLRPAVAADSVAKTVVEAELQGRAYRRSLNRPTFPTRSDSMAHVGTPDRVCVEVGSAAVARSGDFYAGPFKLYPEYWHEVSNWSKLWWQPGHMPEPDQPYQLTVRIALLDAAPEAYIYRSESITRPKANLEQIKETPFFGSAIHLPHPGRWLMVPSTGSNWGCVIFAFK